MNTKPSKSQEIMVDKDRFDAVLRKIANTKPLPLKDLTGTFPNVLPRRRKSPED
jgi:hypothetical protein